MHQNVPYHWASNARARRDRRTAFGEFRYARDKQCRQNSLGHSLRRTGKRFAILILLNLLSAWIFHRLESSKAIIIKAKDKEKDSVWHFVCQCLKIQYVNAFDNIS